LERLTVAALREADARYYGVRQAPLRRELRGPVPHLHRGFGLAEVTQRLAGQEVEHRVAPVVSDGGLVRL
jgi:hypothetical protein